MKSNLEDSPINAGKRKWRRPLLFLVVAAALVLDAVVLLGGRLVARVAATDQLRSFISARIGRQLGGQAGLHPIEAHGLYVHSLGLLARAEPPRALTELRAHDLSASLSLIELWRGKWRINYVKAAHVQGAYGSEAAKLLDRAEADPPELVAPSDREPVMSVDVRKVAIARADLFWGAISRDAHHVIQALLREAVVAD